MMCICQRRLYDGTPPHDSWCQLPRDETDAAATREPSPVEPFADYVARIKAERAPVMMPGMYTTVAIGPISRTRYFNSSSSLELRRLVSPIGPEVGRPQLLALCRNRWPCGYWIETEEPWPQRTNEVSA